jgi:SAM-dependent methyltransferase
MYAEKDYETECDLIESIFSNFGVGSIERVLDLGCGTGNHAIPLGRRGFDVTGVDRSESMLGLARTKAAAAGVDITFARSAIQDLDLDATFDAGLLMFAVLGYQLENDDVIRSLDAIRRHLREGALLLFDVWYGPAVLMQRPSPRFSTVESGDQTILKASSGVLSTDLNRCTVEIQVWRLEGGRLAENTVEAHDVRYFFVPELEQFMEGSGFKLARVGAFPDFDRDPDPTTWNVMGVARAV